jgi:ABC-type cobalamin/Fe3+-siderophores transport system ATPase subunit
MIGKWRRARRAVIMVLHDINLAVRFSDYLLFLYGDGEASHGLVTEMATEPHFSRLYDQPMGRYQAHDRDLFFPL